MHNELWKFPYAGERMPHGFVQVPRAELLLSLNYGRNRAQRADFSGSAGRP